MPLERLIAPLPDLYPPLTALSAANVRLGRSGRRAGAPPPSPGLPVLPRRYYSPTRATEVAGAGRGIRRHPSPASSSIDFAPALHVISVSEAGSCTPALHQNLNSMYGFEATSVSARKPFPDDTPKCAHAPRASSDPLLYESAVTCRASLTRSLPNLCPPLTGVNGAGVGLGRQ